MRNLYIDIETYSSTDLTKSGVYKYAESDDFEILLFGYAFDNSPVTVVDIASGEVLPNEVKEALNDCNVLKWAHNAAFERICISRFIGLPQGIFLNPSSWRCSMVLALYNGLPRSLADVGEVLKLDKKKLTEGKELIKYFCMPCKETKVNGGRTRNYYFHDKEKWNLFKYYNLRDVEAEIEIINKLIKFNAPDDVWNQYAISEEINDRGVLVSMDLVLNAIQMDEEIHQELTKEMQLITNLENPNSVAQQKEWLSKLGVNVDTLGKKDVAQYSEIYKNTVVGKMMDLRKMLSKSSVKKYQAMVASACKDNRVRGMFMFYGARTGRWISRIVQLQNLPRNEISDLDNVRELVKKGDLLALRLLYDDVPTVLSNLIRTAFIAPKDEKYIVADFSAIEARVLAWLAGEQWRLDTFKANKDIYCASASQMFHVPVEKHGVNGHLRSKGKVAELALGYGGSTGALTNMGALDMGLKVDELPELVAKWREANPNIVAYWHKVDRAIKKVITDEYKKSHQTVYVGKIGFKYQSGMLFILLPSGRRLTYVRPRIGVNRFGSESILYEGLDITKKISLIESYSAKFVENIVQAVARDLLMNSISRLRNYRIVAHVHDELIIEVPMDVNLGFICEEMAKVPDWADGLILRADGFETSYYMKD